MNGAWLQMHLFPYSLATRPQNVLLNDRINIYYGYFDNSTKQWKDANTNAVLPSQRFLYYSWPAAKLSKYQQY